MTADLIGSLSRQQARFFRDAGYLKLPAVLEPKTLEGLRGAARDLLRDADDPVERGVDGTVVKVLGLIDRGEEFAQLAAAEALIEPLKSLLGPNIEILRNRHNHLTSGEGASGAGRLHRDVLQWSRTIVTALVFLDDTWSVESATRILPGSHLLPFVGRPNNGGTWLSEHHMFGDLVDQAVPIPARAGDVLLLDGVAFHQSGPETSLHERLCITFAYRPVDELAPPNPSAVHRVLVSGEDIYRGNPGPAAFTSAEPSLARQ